MKVKLFILALVFSCSYISVNADSKPGKNQFQKELGYAEKAYAALDFREAIKHYEEAARLNSSKKIFIKLADCYQKIHQPEKAIEQFEKAMKTDELSKEESMTYGEALIDAGRYEEAHLVLKDYKNESYWVEKKVSGIADLESFFQYKDAYEVNPVPFNTEASEFSPTFHGGGLVIVASRSNNNPLSPKYNWDNSSYLDLFQVKDEAHVEKMHKSLNSQFHEGPAVFYESDQKIIFTRNQFEGYNSRIPGEQVNHLKLFYSEKKSNGKWKSPKMLPFNIEGYSFGHPAINEDGSELYFASNMEGGMGGTDLYKVTFDGENWSKPELLRKGINTEKDELFPTYHKGSLYFASEGLEGLGGLDIFKIDLENENSEPANLGSPINTKGDDFGMVWSETDKKGYFSSNREGGTGKDDIYEFSLFEHEVQVKLIDQEGKKPLNGDIQILEMPTQDLISKVENVSEQRVDVIRGSKLKIMGSADGYESAELLFDTKSVSKENIKVYLEVKLTPIKVNKRYILVMHGEQIYQQLAFNEDGSAMEFIEEESTSEPDFMVNHVYFDYDDYTLNNTENDNLDQLIDVLQLNKEITVTLTGYTDPKGAETYNIILSEQRAKAAGDYLLSNGISMDRINMEGKGELEVNGDCDEACMQSLRRTEIALILK